MSEPVTGFEAEWLTARQRYDDDALDQGAIAAIRSWAGGLARSGPLIVVDLGSGTGVALRRAAGWLAPGAIDAYAVDADARLLARVASEFLPREDGQGAVGVTPLAGDLLGSFVPIGGPADGTVDLVLGHAIADLLPLDRLAARVAALLRPGGLAHLALTYDGQTAFAPTSGDPFADADLDARVIAAFHRQMDRPRHAQPAYGGSTAGRRLGPALVAAGLAIVREAPSVWQVAAGDGPAGRAVLRRLLQYVVEAVRADGTVQAPDLAAWEQRRRAALADGILTARVAHRDVLARKPASR